MHVGIYYNYDFLMINAIDLQNLTREICFYIFWLTFIRNSKTKNNS
jgi:hypothetical protein